MSFRPLAGWGMQRLTGRMSKAFSCFRPLAGWGMQLLRWCKEHDKYCFRPLAGWGMQSLCSLSQRSTILFPSPRGVGDAICVDIRKGRSQSGFRPLAGWGMQWVCPIV